MLIQTQKEGQKEAYTKAWERLEKEITRAPVELEVPTEAAMAGSLERGDIFLHDPTDDGKEKGAFAWISAEPSWEKIEHLYAVQIWGPSERHLEILIDVCQWGVDNGIGDYPISYQRSNHPLTVIADQYARCKFSEDGKFATTTLREALAGLSEARRG